MASWRPEFHGGTIERGVDKSVPRRPGFKRYAAAESKSSILNFGNILCKKWCARRDDFRTFLGDFVAALPQIDRGQVNQAASDAALGCVGGANTAENTVTHSFAGVVHFHDFRREGEHLASSGDQMVELDFHIRRIVDEAKADFANFGDCSDDLEAANSTSSYRGSAR